MLIPERKLNGWADDAKAAITANPDYFVRWYTAKSLLLVGVSVALAYMIGKQWNKRSHHKKKQKIPPVVEDFFR